MIWNDDDIEMQELADAANAAAGTKRNRAFDPETDGPRLAGFVEGAVYNMTSVYEAVTACAEDYGFAHDDAADAYAFDLAQRYKAELDRKERAEGRPW